jgi:hypothetical protein
MKQNVKNIAEHYFIVLLGFFSLISQCARSGEFLIIDKAITWDENAQSAFYMFMPDATMPSNWMYPDDYYNGMIYTRYEILEVATRIPCGMQFGIFQWKDANHTVCGELCENIRWLENGTGSVAENGSSPSTWWESYGGVDFSKISDLQSLSPTIWSKDPRSPIARPGQGGDDAGEAWRLRYNWFPITVRVTVVAVSAGSAFSGWDYYIGNTPPNSDVFEKYLLVYPNPGSDGLFNIQTDIEPPFTLEVLSTDGKILKSTTVQETLNPELSLQELNQGIYIIRVLGNNFTVARKIIR